jgi:hypothetical protein
MEMVNVKAMPGLLHPILVQSWKRKIRKWAKWGKPTKKTLKNSVINKHWVITNTF